ISLVVLDAECLQRSRDTLFDVGTGHRVVDSQQSAHDREDRVVRDRASVRRTARLELEHGGRVEAANELVQQSGLPDAGLADETHDRPGALGSSAERANETLELALPTREGREPALPRDLETRASEQLPRDRDRAHRRRLALDRELAEVVEDEE